MTYDQLTTGYLWCIATYSVVSIAVLAFRHREHINFKSVQTTMLEGEKPDIPTEAQARWNRESTLVGRIGTALFIGWILIAFFGRLITTP